MTRRIAWKGRYYSMALSTRSLRIFSAVEVLREGQADIRFALAPLFQADLSKFDGQLFDSVKFSNEINAQYRLNITRDVVEELVPVFSELGWLQRVQGEDRAYLVSCTPDAKVSGDRNAFEEQAKALAADFRAFIEHLSPLSQVDVSDENLIDSLVDWLISLDVLTEEDLKTVAQVGKIGRKLVYQVAQPDEVRSDDISYLCARYVESIVHSQSPTGNFLVELASVGLITEVIRDFHKPSTIVNRTDLAVYLDAPVALDFLGLSGKEAKENIRAILDKIVTLGGSIRIYRLSIDEMQTSLSAMLNRRPQDRDGATASALRRGEVLEAFVRQVSANPDPFLREAGIGIVEQTLDQYPNEHRFFEKAAVDDMYSQIGWVKEDAPRFHDAAAAALTLRKRRGARSSDLFEVKHVVVTRNPFYGGLARRIAQKFSYINATQVGPVIHQRQLATAVWLRAGFGQNDESIPRKYILSACRRVLTLRRNIVERVKRVGADLSPEQAQQLELLLTQDRSTQVLMDKTLGTENLIDSSNIALLLEEMKQALVADIKKDAESEIRQLKASAQKQRRELQRVIESGANDVAELRHALEAREQAELEIKSSLIRRVNRRARKRRRIAVGLAILIVIAAEVVSFTASGAKGALWLAAITFLIALSVALFRKEWIQAQWLDPLFKAWDERTLELEAADLGIDYDTLEQQVTYQRGAFQLLT